MHDRERFEAGILHDLKIAVRFFACSLGFIGVMAVVDDDGTVHSPVDTLPLTGLQLPDAASLQGALDACLHERPPLDRTTPPSRR